MRLAVAGLIALMFLSCAASAQTAASRQPVVPTGTMYNGKNARLQPPRANDVPAGAETRAGTGGASVFGNPGSNTATGAGAAGVSGGGNVSGGEH